MKCSDVLALLPDYLEGAMPHDLSVLIEDHVSNCVECWYHLLLLRRKSIKIRIVQTKVTVIQEVWR